MLRTERLLLRPWRDDDYAPYAAINADPEVRRWWSAGTLSRAQSDAHAEELRQHIEDHGFGFWAVEVPGVSPFVGFIGLLHVDEGMPFSPGIQAGWRLTRAHWGHGYAAEGARAAIDDGFRRLGFSEIVAYAVECNMPSRRVMARIGMHHNPDDDFDHPFRPNDDPLRRHVLYRIRAAGTPSISMM